MWFRHLQFSDDFQSVHYCKFGNDAIYYYISTCLFVCSVCQFWKTFVTPVRHVCSSHRPPSIIIFLHVCPYGMSLLKYVRHACSSHIFVNTGKTESVQKLWRTSTNAWPLNQLSYRSCHIILTYQPQSVSQHLITEGQVTYTYSYQANTRNMHTSLPIL